MAFLLADQTKVASNSFGCAKVITRGNKADDNIRNDGTVGPFLGSRELLEYIELSVVEEIGSERLRDAWLGLLQWKAMKWELFDKDDSIVLMSNQLPYGMGEYRDHLGANGQ